MTDWKKLAKAAILADGAISASVGAVLKREVLADGRVNREEAEFLMDLQRNATSVAPDFRSFVYDIVKRVVLPDGEISRSETTWLQALLLHDRAVDPAERRLLKELKDAALVTCPEFDELCLHYESV